MAGANPAQGSAAARPLSPHLQIYSPHINMVMSILHRMTGSALYLGTILLAWWLVAAATGPDYFGFVNSIFGSWPGRVVLFLYSWALFHHMAGGVRHFIWDMGKGYELSTIDFLSWATLGVSVTLTALVWLYVGVAHRGLMP